ncbi:TIGR03826 family flagellar region protein [Halobacillus litoralis]|uniref:TIGR03826 family flagellar region protein n=1 Tax=Halobacillus litoralis TaxID=45668 RepID=UPI001CFF4ABB|nr:TIGR03826 family flagellar region protein [Halobacillus litoralis]
MGDLANCPRCNALFMKGAATVCPACVKKEEADFQTVYAFIRKKVNRTATVDDIVRETGVPEKQIRKFVKQKRLHPAHFPNLTYGCEKCGRSIREGRICEGCNQSIQTGLQREERNKEFSERIKETKKDYGRTYYSLDN